MATLNLKSIATLVANQAAAIQANASALIDFTVGSVLLAFTESVAAVAVWLQGMVLAVLAASRLSTSTGSDVDTFVADYGLYRLASSQSAGSVTFSRYASTQSALVPVGAQVQSADGSQSFVVIADPTNSFYSSTLSGFLIPANVASAAIEVASLNAGTATNVVAGGVNRLLTSISGVDYVNNAAAMSGGASAETDAALKIRFVLFLMSLSKATAGAVGYAIASLQLGVQFTITQNLSYSGATQYGYFYVVVDDGTGSPPGSLLTTVYGAVAPVAPLCISFNVFSPLVAVATISGTIGVAAGYNAPAVKGAVGQAWASFVSNLGLGNGLNYTQLAAIAYATPGVTDVTNLLLNGYAGVDMVANPQFTIKPGTVSAN